MQHLSSTSINFSSVDNTSSTSASRVVLLASYSVTPLLAKTAHQSAATSDYVTRAVWTSHRVIPTRASLLKNPAARPRHNPEGSGMAPAAIFSKDEKALCFHHELLYEAKILDVKPHDSKKGSFLYKVHYKGWKNT